MPADPLWALLKIGAHVGRRVWRPRKIDAVRKASVFAQGLRYTLAQGIDWVQHDARSPRVRIVYSIESGRPDDSAGPLLLRISIQDGR